MKLTEKRKDGICNICVGIVALVGGYVTAWIVCAIFIGIGLTQFFTRDKGGEHGAKRFLG